MTLASAAPTAVTPATPISAGARPIVRWRTGPVVQVLAVATLLGLISSGQHNLVMRQTGGPTDVWHALGMGLPYWYLWALFVPVVWASARRFPLTRHHWLRVGAIHLGIAIVLTPLHALLEIQVQHVLAIRHASFGMLTRMSLYRAGGQLPYDLLAYAAILALVVATDASRRARQDAIRAAALDAELSEARFLALRAQLNPHFLFNAMNSIAMLVRKKENDTAVTAIAGLSDLLRDFLDERAPVRVPLREELGVVERYLAVEQLRFRDRLTVSVTSDPAALEVLVPNLLLQPLAENAIKHGISRSASAGRLDIRARVEGTNLVIEVLDDGPGPAGAAVDGVGLRSVRARLAHLYGEQQAFALTRGVTGGALALVTLPLEQPRA